MGGSRTRRGSNGTSQNDNASTPESSSRSASTVSQAGNQEIQASMPTASPDLGYLSGPFSPFGASVDPRDSSADVSRTERNEDGHLVESHAMSVSADQNSARFSLQHVRGEEEERRGGGVWIDGQHGAGRSGAIVGGSIHTGHFSHRGHSGRIVAVGAPEAQADGSFAVVGTITGEAGLGTGGELDPSLAADFGASTSRQHRFRRVFTGPNAAEQARAFRANPRVGEADVAVPRTLGGVMDMQPGEQRARAITNSGSASLGFLGEHLEAPVELGGSASRADELSVERVDANTVRVSVAGRSSLDGAVGMSAAGTGLSYGGAQVAESAMTYEIDLTHPGAEEAYAAVLSEEGPTGLRGPGWRCVRGHQLDRSGSGMQAQLFGHEIDGLEMEEHEVNVTDAGIEDLRRWNTDDVGVSTTRFRQRTMNDDASTYRLSNTVSRDDFGRAQGALADLSGDQRGIAVGGVEGRSLLERFTPPQEGGILPTLDDAPAPDHQWSVESDFSQEQLTEFRRTVHQSRRAPGQLSPRLHAEWYALRDRLRDDPSDMDAVGDFFQATGVQGMRTLRDAVGEPDAQYTSLGDGQVFMGRAASQATEDQVVQFEAAPRDLGELRALRLDLQHRLDAMSAEGSYPDLPSNLRLTEQIRLGEWIARLDDVERMQERPARQRDVRSLSAEEAERAEVLREQLTPQSATEDAAEQMPEDARFASMRGNVEEAHQRLMEVRRQANALWAAHNRLSEGSSETPRQSFTGGLTWLLGDAMDEGYERMEHDLNAAGGMFSVAEENYQQSLLVSSEDVASLSPSALEGLQQMRNALGYTRMSIRTYERVIAGLTRMRDRQISERPSVWGRREEE